MTAFTITPTEESASSKLEELTVQAIEEARQEGDSATILAMTRRINARLAAQVQKSNTQGSEAVYSSDILKLYDAMVWGFNSPVHWRITQEYVQSMYNENLQHSIRHCEVATGTGLFLYNLDENVINTLDSITLVDLNPNSLGACEQRLREKQAFSNRKIDKVLCDILQTDHSVDLQAGSYDTVAGNFLLHCLHGGKETNRKAVAAMALLLKPETGIFFGTTILGKDLFADADNAGQAALETNRLYCDIGIFGNEEDSFDDLSDVLHECFEQVQVVRIGYCAAWKAQRPKRA